MGTDKKGNQIRGLFKRGNAWYLHYYYKGRRIRERVSRDKRIAEKALYATRTAIEEGRYLDKRKMPKIRFEDFAQEYIQTYARLHKKSWVTDVYSIKALSRLFAGHYLFEISPQMIESYKSSRLSGKLGKKVSTSTITKELSCLSKIFCKAQDWGKVSENPLRKVQYFRPKNHRERYLEINEIQTLISNCPVHLKPIVIVAVNTGMRRSEILNLKWQDISIKDWPQKSFITLLDTKNGQKREVVLNETVKRLLIKWPKHSNSNFVFCKEDGQPYKRIEKSFKSACEKSGIKYGTKDFVFHCLRHTTGSQLDKLGYSMNAIKTILGHKDIRTTQKYVHSNLDYENRAVNDLGKALQQPQNSPKDTLTGPDRKTLIPELVTNR